MIVVDTSALVAIIQHEDGARDLVVGLARGLPRLLPVSCYLEAAIVLRPRKAGRATLDQVVKSFGIDIVGAEAGEARLAADAHERFGRGSGHRARLNFGDCLVYAAAMARDAQLLFKGDDFVHTDVKRAV